MPPEALETTEDESVEQTDETTTDVDDEGTPSTEDDAAESAGVELADDEPSGEQEPEGGDDTDEDPFTADLLANAEQLGLSEDEARAFGDPDQLTRALTMFDKRIAASTRQDPDQPDETPAQQAPSDFKPDIDLAALGLDDADPEVRDAFNKVSEHYKGVFEQLRTEMRTENQQILDRLNQREAVEFEQQFYDLIDQSGDDIKPLLAKETAQQEVIDTMAALQAGLERHGKPGLSTKDLFNRAVRMLHGDQITQNALAKAQQSTKAKLQKRAGNGQFISRPTSQTSGEPKSGKDLAVEAVREKMAEWGALDD